MSDFKGFTSVELRRPTRSTFDLSHDKRLTAQMGYLYPILCLECVPSDKFEGNTEMLVRMAPLLAPLYDQINVYCHYFFVPNRLLWDEWETFITGGQFGPSVVSGPPPMPPQVNVEAILGIDPTQFSKSDLADYLGIPLLGDLPNAPDPVDWGDAYIDAMPFVAYQKIWFDYYRDRNFVDDATAFTGDTIPFGSGVVANVTEFIAEHMSIRSRSYKHDYFTSAMLEAQRGDQVMIPSTVNYLAQSQAVYSLNDLPVTTNEGLATSAVASGFGGNTTLSPGASGLPIRLENLDTIGPMVNDFRSAFALQVWLERNQVGGSRYSESIEAHFDVKPQDSRLQRAEYIGGGLVNIKISEVVATAWSNDGTSDIPQGNMAGRGVGYGDYNRFSWFCPEHGFIFGIMSIMNPPSYHQGLPKMFRRQTFLDYPWPTFAKLGEQEVYDWELYAASVNWNSQDRAEWPVFGYQSRYAEWKSMRNTSHGDFHDTMLFWTLTRDFGITPVLDNPFVEFDPNIEDRIFAVPAVDNFWIYLHNRVTAHRPLPYFGTPNTLGFV